MRVALAVVAIALACARARAEPAAAACEHTGKQLRVARGTPVIDGALDDEVWRHACFARDFEEQQPQFGGKPKHPIEVAVAIDATTLYVAARMWSDGPDDLDAALTRRDDLSAAERFVVSLDPSNTRRTAYSFALTARGVRADWKHTDDSEGARDYSWDPVWIGKSKILADGWSVEMAIPLSQLRLPRIAATSWGIDFNWYIPRTSEDVYWRAVPLDRRAWASYFGALTDLPPVHSGLNLELLPYVSLRGSIDEVRPAYPDKRALAGVEAGIDAKLHPLPGLAINATINPDFGQVDADPEFVNLTQYEVQLPEKRPFFVENNSILTDSPLQMFYSRRIGGLPLRLPDYDAIDLPTYTRILGAVAVGGFVASHTQVAAIAALSDATNADAIDVASHRELLVSPLTGWGVARVEQQTGASVLGATATIVTRDQSGTPINDVMPSSAATGEADGTLRSDDGEWEGIPYVAFSSLAGSPAAITATEEDSTHYFQRPDQPYLHLDEDATHLFGWATGVEIDRRNGAVRPDVSLSFKSPGFDLNDTGALAYADDISLGATLGYYDTTPGKALFSWDAVIGAAEAWTFGDALKPGTLRAWTDVTLTNFWYGGASWTVRPPGLADDLTRGGPLMGTDWSSQVYAYASTPGGRTNRLRINASLYNSRTLNSGFATSAALTWRPRPQLRLDFQPSLTLIQNSRQYIDTVTGDGGGYLTYGSRYIFGHLDRKEASMVLRATWALTPDFAFTLYAQPFVSVGRYNTLGELVAASSRDVRWYAETTSDPATGLRTIVDDETMATFTVPEPNYTLASLRSTAVLRWEMRPGSVLYVVWQQQRGGTSSAVAEPLKTASPEILTDPAVHTLAVKLSYWFG